MLQKARHQTHGANSVNSQPIFKNFASDSPVNLQQSIYYRTRSNSYVSLHYLVKTLMSENEQQSQTNAVINDKLQGIVVTYLRCSGIFSNQINSGLLLSLPVKKI